MNPFNVLNQIFIVMKPAFCQGCGRRIWEAKEGRWVRGQPDYNTAALSQSKQPKMSSIAVGLASPQ